MCSGYECMPLFENKRNNSKVQSEYNEVTEILWLFSQYWFNFEKEKYGNLSHLNTFREIQWNKHYSLRIQTKYLHTI